MVTFGEQRTVGLILGSLMPPNKIRETARLAEDLGYDELWCSEDYFYTAGVSAVTAALAATEKIRVGTSIVSALVRHPAVLAMEIATISGMFPGRFTAGIGLGAAEWVRQMGLYPKSRLGAIRERVEAVRQLLSGEELTYTGSTFSANQVKLTHAVDEKIPLYLGVIGSKGLHLSGEIADGTMVPLLTTPAFVEWVRRQTGAGANDVGRGGDRHRVIVFVFFSVGPTSKEAKSAIRDLLAYYLFISAYQLDAVFDHYGITEELKDMVARGGLEGVCREMPDQWIEDLAVVGDPGECASKINRFFEAGADAVGLFPMPPDRVTTIATDAARLVLPQLALNDLGRPR
jgi:alkanesulfonate monooxygenase SsuD/methylene tetrahydromethanopterin reductase-like flavin-dependent oxidoreductase (luciferase family)